MSNDNYYSGTIRGYGANNQLNNNTDFMNNFNPKNYMNNPNIAVNNNINNNNKNPSPVKIFSNYYLNNSDPNNIDNGYSKKKNYLMKDYYSKEKLDRDEFVK